MVGIGVRPRLPPARRRAYEHASSRVAAIQSEAISLRQPTQMPRLRLHASGVLARPQTLTAAARRQYRCDHCPPLPSPAVGSRHKPEPSARLAGYYAKYPTRRERSPNRKQQKNKQTKHKPPQPRRNDSKNRGGGGRGGRNGVGGVWRRAAVGVVEGC